MLLERIESEGLAHTSYLIGDQRTAAVIDPRRDCQVYVDRATKAGFRIAYVLETHRNEDYVIGSCELASRTDAQIWHADSQWDYQYGRPVEDGQTWSIGRLRLEAIHSPGHTPGSMSYLLYDPDGAPWVAFTGDALFAGDVGRVDLLGMERAEEMAGLLYDTLFNRLLPLGDSLIVCPAHGSGSACGSAIAERTWTTLGLERRLNPRLQSTDRDAFIEKAAKELDRPPYFRRMERLNLEGAPLLGTLPVPTPLTPPAFAARMESAFVLDTRTELAFAAAHVPGSLSIWQEGLTRFAGWFLPSDRPILLVTDTDDPTPTVRHLIRLGYDDLVGTLAGGLLAWHKSGRQSASIGTITVQDLCRQLDAGSERRILDIRKEEELAQNGQIADAQHIPITRLPHRMHEVDRDRPVYLFCGSGLRSTTAASMLKRQGWENLTVVLGGLSGWSSVTCPINLWPAPERPAGRE
jgi:hydroxyacylglutathione hydrolase